MNKSFPQDKWLDKYIFVKGRVLAINSRIKDFHGENIMSEKICVVCHWNFENEGHDKNCPIPLLEKLADEL